MFDPPTPEEEVHARFRAAALAGDVNQVRQILAENPGAPNDTQRMPHTVLQALCLQMFSFRCKPEHIECMLAIVEAGGDMAMGYNHTSSPVSILISRGVMPALHALQDNGYLADAIMPEQRNTISFSLGVQGVQALTFVCVPKQWRDLDRNYPIAELVEVLLEAGAQAYQPFEDGEDPGGPQPTHRSACSQLLWALDGATSYRPPNGCARALAMLMEHDPQTRFDEQMVLRSWRSKIEPVFEMVTKRYFEQGGSHQDLQAMVKSAKLKPEMAAKLQADAFKVMTPEAPAARKAPSSRF